MQLLTRALGVRTAIEIGTFTGYSALTVALALPEDGRLLACDISDEYTRVGRPDWEQAGVAHKIDLIIAQKDPAQAVGDLVRDLEERHAVARAGRTLDL